MMNLTPYFNSKLGAEIRVTGHSHRGQTKRQEDAMDVAFQSPSDSHIGNSLYAFFGVFDGHGGPEAALYVKKHLMSHIINQPNFWSDNDSRILRAIKDGYLSVQEALWLDRQTKMSLSSSAASSSSARHLPYPSFPGTTATIAFLKEGKLYVGHIGNSGIVIGYQEPGYHFWRAKKVTEEHTPDKLPERERMRRSGLAVKSAHGIPRVVSRSTYFQQGTTRNDDDEIAVDNNSPFLPLARSLGDLWSYSREKHHFLVSPVPDTFVVEVDSSFRCLIFATDGLWTVVTEQDAVDTVFHAERAKQFYQGDQTWTWTNPSKKLVKQALSEWRTRRLRADNTSVVTVVFDRLTSKPNRLSEVENQLHRVSSKDEIMIQYYKAVIIVSILLMTFFAYIKYIDA